MSHFDTYCWKKYNIKVKSLVHAGGEHCQEAKFYHENRIDEKYPIIFIEANPRNMGICKNEVSKYPNEHIYNYVVSDKSDELVDFYLYSHGSSDSIYLPDKMNEWYTHHKVRSKVQVPTITLDDLVERNGYTLE